MIEHPPYAGIWPRQRLALTIALLLAGLQLSLPQAATTAERMRVDVDLFVPVLQRLEINSRVVAFPSPLPPDFAAGHIDLQKPITLAVFSNIPWQLLVRTVAGTPGTPRGNQSDALPLQCSVDDQPFVRLTTDWIAVTAGGDCADGRDLQLALRIPLTWTTMKPGRYQPKVEYMLAAAQE